MDEGDRIFNPSLNQQRYNFVIDLINSSGSRVITDVGCSECSFIEKVKFLCPNVVQLDGIDIDKPTLEFNLQKTKPLVCDGLFPRPKKLETKIYHGSVEMFDYRVGENCDLLSAIEVIEHLHPEQIPNFTNTIFGQIRPGIVVLTTPNVEFNVVFKNGRNMKFRHYDHKFEWTRPQFRHYCDSVVSKYDYTYKIAVFTRNSSADTSNDNNNYNCGHRQINFLDCDQSQLFNYELLSWEYFYTSDEQSNSELKLKIDLIEQLLFNNPNETNVCELCNGDSNRLNCSQFYHINYPSLKDVFPYFQLFIDFIRFHTHSQINPHNNNANNDPNKSCFIFRKKPTPIVISLDANSYVGDEEEFSSSSSSFNCSPFDSAAITSAAAAAATAGGNTSSMEDDEPYWD